MLEICVDTIESVRAAFAGGATRVELCSSLSEGGLTPTQGFLKIVKQEFPDLIVFVMLRPRGGSDFVYSQLEMDCLMEDMRALRTHGADGFVFGSLNPNRTICVEQARRVLASATPLPVTFHRAFDRTASADWAKNFTLLHALGFRRLLTSGQAPTAVKGIQRVRELVQLSVKPVDGEPWGTRPLLTVVAGGGITPANAESMLRVTGCAELHGSALPTPTEEVGAGEAKAAPAPPVPVNGVDFGVTVHTDQWTVRQLVNIIVITALNCVDAETQAATLSREAEAAKEASEAEAAQSQEEQVDEAQDDVEVF